MEQIRNRFGLPVQSGEFISIENGECHVLCYVEEWEDAPEGTSGYRGVYVHGLYIGKFELRARVINDRGFAELDSEYKQSFAAEPMPQDLFDLWIDSNCDRFTFVPVTATEFLEKLMIVNDGCFFVKFARGFMYIQEICGVQEAWMRHKLDSKVARPSASEASDWVREYLKDKPGLNAPWIADDIFTEISCIEEPAEWDGSKHPFVGKTVLIRSMAGEPQYSGRVGTVISVDDAGQIHGTWGGCALTDGDDFVFLDEDGTDPEHYNDGWIDFRVVREFDMIAFVNRDGESKTVSYEDAFFSAADLVAAYVSLWHDSWGEDREGFVDAFKTFLCASGCAAEELEGCDDE